MQFLLCSKMHYLWLYVFSFLVYHVEANIKAVDSNQMKETFYDTELIIFNEIEGVVVQANPTHACSNITGPPPELLNTSINCFVLIEDGTCSALDKIRNAHAAKFAAAIIHTTDMVVLWDNRFALRFRVPSQFNITSVAVSRYSGQRLIDHFLYTVDPGSRIYIYYNQFHQLWQFFNEYYLLTLLIIFTCFVFSVPLSFIKYLQIRRMRRRYRLSSRHLKHLETMKYKSDTPYDTCAICLEDYKEKDKLRILPCSHAYHCKCIDPWLTNNKRTCPVCKQKVRIPGMPDDEEHSDSDTEGRAETAPLIRGPQRSADHGTFTSGRSTSSGGIHSASNVLRIGSGETTSRDVPSDALDESSEEEATGVKNTVSEPDVLVVTSQPTITTTHGSQYSNADLTEPLLAKGEASHDDAISNNSNTTGNINTQKGKTYVV